MLESSARFHAADGLAVCVCLLCIDWGGGEGCLMVCIGMSGVYLSMCPLILQIEFALWLFGGAAVCIFL